MVIIDQSDGMKKDTKIKCGKNRPIRQGAVGEHEQGGELQPQVLHDQRQQHRQGLFHK